MLKTRHLCYSSVALAASLLSGTANAQNATIYYTQPTIVSGQPVQNAAPVITPVPVVTPRPDSEPTLMVEPDGHEAYVPAPATPATPADVSYLGEPQVQVSQHDQSVTFVSGGIGAFEKQWFDNSTSSYPLKVTYSDSTGHHLAGVNVTLDDAKGGKVLATVTEGPYLLVNAKPGVYSLTSTYEGQSKTQKVTIGKGKSRASVTFQDSGL